MKMNNNDIQFSWNAGYKAGVRDCQLLIANEIIESSRFRNATAKISCLTLKEIKADIEKMLQSWEEVNNA